MRKLFTSKEILSNESAQVVLEEKRRTSSQQEVLKSAGFANYFAKRNLVIKFLIKKITQINNEPEKCGIGLSKLFSWMLF